MTAGVCGALFLCHGAGGDADSMAALRVALGDAGCAPAIALSYPGRQQQPGPPRESVDELAAAVREQVQGVLGDLDQPHVVLGHSMGGAVAIEYALRAPPGLRALVLVSTGARLRVHPSILQALEADPSAAGSSSPTSLAQGLERSTRTPRLTALADWRAANAFDRMDRVGEITTPTLILVGEADVLTPLKYARFLSERIASSRLTTLPAAGHSLPTEQPERVAELTAAFLTGLTAVGAAQPPRGS